MASQMSALHSKQAKRARERRSTLMALRAFEITPKLNAGMPIAHIDAWILARIEETENR